MEDQENHIETLFRGTVLFLSLTLEVRDLGLNSVLVKNVSLPVN